QGSTIQGNLIGTQADGASPLGNNLNGALLTYAISGPYPGPAYKNTIGGVAAGARNVIAFNGGDGVNISGSGADGIQGQTLSGNSIRGNSIFSNTGLGIDLGTNGVTLNDLKDSDTGANNLQNFPILSAAGGPAGLVAGSLNAVPNATITLDFYASPN